MLTQEKHFPQVSAPQVWDKPTAEANVGDYFYIPFTPTMQVVEKDTLSDGRVWLLVKPTNDSYTEEWVLESEPAIEPQRQLPAQLEKTEPQQPVGIAGDTVSCQWRSHQLQTALAATATMAEWEEAAKLVPAGYRLKNGWFYDSNGGRCNLPSTKLSQRQIDILTGLVPIR
jgi:hypothetical protein